VKRDGPWGEQRKSKINVTSDIFYFLSILEQSREKRNFNESTYGTYVSNEIF
jgi:hypothetical protein